MAVFLLTCLVALVSVSGAFTAWNLTRLQRRVHDLEARQRRRDVVLDAMLAQLEARLKAGSN